LRDRVLALRFCRVETVGAARVVAVDDHIQRVDVSLGTGHPRNGVGRAVAARVAFGTVLLTLRLLEPRGLGRGELHAGEGGTAERHEAIRPGVGALAGTLLTLDEALRLFGDELPLSETRADLAFRFVVGDLRASCGREAECKRRSQGERRPTLPS